MRNWMRFVAFCTAVCILLLPLASGNPVENSVSEKKDTEQLVCYVGSTCVEKQIPSDTIEDIIALGASCRDAFLTIYDKTSTELEVSDAFLEIRPFFQALVDQDLTDKTVPELEQLYRDIRQRIRKPRTAEASPGDGEVCSTGLWNGVPVPLWVNVGCGIFDAGSCIGFALGTHTLVPTIGADLFITYAFTGTSTTVGFTGVTQAFSAFQVIFGFVGVLIVTPIIMFGPYFMTGICGALIGGGV